MRAADFSARTPKAHIEPYVWRGEAAMPCRQPRDFSRYLTTIHNNIYIYILEDDKVGDHQIILTSTGRSPFLQCEAP